MEDFDPIHQVFDLDNTFVLLYENDDETYIGALIDILEDQESIFNIHAYATTIGQSLTESEISDALTLDEMLVGLVLRNYFSLMPPTLSLGEFLQFLQDDLADLPLFLGMIPTDEVELEYLVAAIEPEMMAQIVTIEELATVLQLDVEVIRQLLYVHDLIYGEPLVGEMTLIQFVDHLLIDFAQMPLFESLFAAEVLSGLEAISLELAEAEVMFVSTNFSRLIINTTFDVESEATFTFIDEITEVFNQSLAGDFYLLGESIMPHELSQTFSGEQRLISLLTIFAFFIIAAISFRSITLSALLAIVIQAAVYIVMGVSYFLDTNMVFLTMIIVQAILKSRVIDYGILYIAHYIEARRNHDVKNAMIVALNHSIDTILTSGLIVILITFVSGLVFMGTDAATAQILLLIAQGCLIGVMMSIFVLPALIAIFDRLVIQEKAH